MRLLRLLFGKLAHFCYEIIVCILIMAHGMLQVHYRIDQAAARAAFFVHKLLGGLFRGLWRIIMTTFLVHLEEKGLRAILEYVEGMVHAPFSQQLNCWRHVYFLCLVLWPS